MAVDQVTGALVCSPTEEQNMSASSFDDIRSVQEVEDEMILSHHKKDAKIEALARRDIPKSGSKPKKGRKSIVLLTLLFMVPFFFLISMISMNLYIFYWNCMSLSNLHTMDRIHSIMKNKKPDFVCLVKTKATIPKVHRFCDKIMGWGCAAIPSNGIFGGIIVLWKRGIGRVTPVVVSRLALHHVIYSKDETWILTTIYNSQSLSQHKNLW